MGQNYFVSWHPCLEKKHLVRDLFETHRYITTKKRPQAKINLAMQIPRENGRHVIIVLNCTDYSKKCEILYSALKNEWHQFGVNNNEWHQLKEHKSYI